MEFSFELYNEILFLIITFGVAHQLSERLQVFLALQCCFTYIKYTYRPISFSFQHIQPTTWIQEVVVCVRQQFFMKVRRKESLDDESESQFSLSVC